MSKRIAWIPLVFVLGGAVAAFAADRNVSGTWWYVLDHVTRVDADAEVVLWAQLPSDRPHQKVRITNIHPTPDAIIESAVDGAPVALWRYHPEEGEEQIYFRVDFRARLKDAVVEVDPGRIGEYDTDSEFYKLHVRSEPWIETDGDVSRTALRIVGKETNPWLRARALYDWMVTEMEFVPGGTPTRNALGTLRNGQGDCAQYAFLFTAFCRSLGIPARVVSVVWLDGDRHRFAEFWLPGYGWIPADPAAGQALDPTRSVLDEEDIKIFRHIRGIPQNVDAGWLFGRLYSNYFVTAVGTAIDLPGAQGDEPVRSIFMEPGGADAAPPAIVLKGLNEDVVHGGFYAFGDEPLGLDAAHELAHQELAARFMGFGLYDIVERGCLVSQKEHKDGVSSWINLGRVYLHKGLYDRAESCFRRALQEPTINQREKLESLIWVHNYLGNCYDLMGRREQAVEEYRQVIKRNEDYRGAVGYAKTYLARPYVRDEIR